MAWRAEKGGGEPLLGHLDHGAGDVVGLAEGHPLAHQVVREVRREHRQVQRLPALEGGRPSRSEMGT